MERGSAYVHAYQVELVPFVSRGERHRSHCGIALPRTAIRTRGFSVLWGRHFVHRGSLFHKVVSRNFKARPLVNPDDAMEELIHDVQDSPFPS